MLLELLDFRGQTHPFLEELSLNVQKSWERGHRKEVLSRLKLAMMEIYRLGCKVSL